MRKTIPLRGFTYLAALTSFGFLLVANQATAQPRRSVTVQPVLRTHAAWLQAYANGDEAALEKLLEPNFLVVTSNGEINTKQALLEQAKRAPAELTMRATDILARRQGATLIVTSKVLEKRAASEMEFRVTDILSNDRGIWRVSSSHWTRTAGNLTQTILSSAALDRLIGTYRTPRGRPLQVMRRGQGLQVVEENGQATPLMALSPVMFFASGGRVRWLFVAETSGEVRHAVIANLNTLTPLARDLRSGAGE